MGARERVQPPPAPRAAGRTAAARSVAPSGLLVDPGRTVGLAHVLARWIVHASVYRLVWGLPTAVWVLVAVVALAVWRGRT